MMDGMKKIIVTGANGFIGSRLCLALVNNGYQVTALVREKADCSLLSNKINKIFMNYNDNSLLNELLDNHDILIHSAAKTKGISYKDLTDTNVELTEKIIQSSNQSKNLKQFIFLSSQAAAGPGKGNTSLTEIDEPHPISWYGQSKLQAELILKNTLNKDWTIIRPASVYGPGDKDFLFYFQFIEKHIAIHPGFNNKYISLIYVDQLIDLILKTILNPKAKNETFFASDGHTYTISTFCDTLGLAMDKFVFPISIPDSMVFMTGAVMEMIGKFQNKIPILNKQKAQELRQYNWLIRNIKAVELLDFNPKSNLLSNLTRTYQWYKKNKWL